MIHPNCKTCVGTSSGCPEHWNIDMNGYTSSSLSPKTFGLDFDETFTADPELFWQFVKIAESRGHKVVIVTARTENGMYQHEVDTAIGSRLRVIYTGMRPKREVVRELGIDIDIWIDDMPEMIVA